MQPAPTVSVVIPTYNRAQMIGDAVRSALQQSLEACEVIVVDDGSSDDTEALVRSYGGRVRFVRTEHGGVAHARNVGMRHVRGKYVTFLDSDDRLYPYALELLVNVLERHPDLAFACAEMSAFDASGLRDRYHLQTYHHSAYRHPRINYDTIFESSATLGELVPVPETLRRDDPAAGSRRVYFGNVFDTYLLHLVLCQNSTVLRTSMLAPFGERNVRVKHWQEVDYLLRITRRHRIGFVDVPTYLLRYHDEQTSSTAGPRGTYVWMRKQQILLRVVRRHALADRSYYERHRRRIDAQLAHLHRAVAVPMLLLASEGRIRRPWVRYARRYLERCRRYGHPARALALAASMPAPLLSHAVRAIESIRRLRWTAIRHLSAMWSAVPYRPATAVVQHVR